jgi:hypothetical protein
MSGLLLAGMLAAVLPATRAWSDPQPQVVYGPDDRREVFGLSGAKAAAAASTVGLVRTSRIANNGDGTSRLLTGRLSTDLDLCPGQRFFSQPTAPFCSGVLVGPDIVATAGHCVTSAGALSGMRFVFGFRLTNATTVRTTIPNADIYRGIRLLARQENSFGADFAVVKLDRRVTGRTPLRIARGNPPAVGTQIYVIGHPSGLPTKIAAGARVVRRNSNFFQANLDTFEGNSGSPVFDARTNTVQGLLVRGAPDYRRGEAATS